MPSNPFKAEPSNTRLALNRIGLRVRNLERRFIGAAATTVGVTTEQFYYDTASADSLATSHVLDNGAQYLIVVQGTFSAWNEVLAGGTPEANAMFPGSTVGRVSTEVGIDADTLFAYPSDHPHPVGHWRAFEISLDGGTTFAHLEPDDGIHGTPAPGHLYRYTVIGQGAAAAFRVSDSPGHADNYGRLSITVEALDGGSGGGSGGGSAGGSGSLVPPTDASMVRDILRVDASGVPAWEAQPSITEADLALSDVTTGDVSITEHGFAPKSPGVATEYLDGTGAYSTPSSSPTGAAGGDLSGTYPNPTVAKVEGSTLGAILSSGLLASRPAAAALPAGSLYVATDDGHIYQTNGATWSVWATLGGGGSLPDPSAQPDGEVLQTSGGAAIWGADPGGGGDTLHTVAASGASQAVNYSTADVWDVTLTADCTITLTGFTAAAPDFLTLILRQDATGGRLVTWPTITWIGSGIPPTLQTAPGSIDSVVLFSFDGGTTVYGIAQTSASGLRSGTSFPGSPSDGDLFYRTDRDVLYFYKSAITKWLSVDLKYVPFSVGRVLNNTSVGGVMGLLPIFEDTYIEDVQLASHLVSGTNNGTNFWTHALLKSAPNNTTTTVGSVTTAADTAAVTTIHTISVAALLAVASYVELLINTTKTGTPGNVQVTGVVRCRSVG